MMGNGLVEILTPLMADFKGPVDEIVTVCQNYERDRAKLAEEGRVLTISIVGAVKSGKSSLLNALLFDGENVLPKAATPMTAALTKIQYAPQCRAEIEFFTENEWHKMEMLAHDYDREYAEAASQLQAEDEKAVQRGYTHRELTRERVIRHLRGKITEEWIAAKELVENVRVSGLDVTSYLNRGEVEPVVISADNPLDLVGKMEDYVGAKGKFTPIVCSTTIYLNDERLKGYEIVDTPGTNDPVIYRGARTSESLGCSDTVIAVSPASQFFQQSDLSLLSELLPRKGIKDFVLVASQYDRAVGEVEDEIDEDLEPTRRLAEARRYVAEGLASNYHKRILEIARLASKSDEGDRWAKLVKARPTCVSALAYSLAMHWGRWTQREKEDAAKLNELIEGNSFTDADSLKVFSNISAVTEQLDHVKEHKQEIISKRIEDRTSGHHQELRGFLEELRDRITGRIEMLETNDVSQLRKKLKDQTCALSAGEELIKATFQEFAFSADTALRDAQNGVRAAKQYYGKLDIRTETETVEYTHDHGCGFLFWRSIFGCRYETRTRLVRTRYANIYDAVDRVEAYVDEARKELQVAIDHVLDRKVLRNKITEVVLETMEDVEGIELNLKLFRAQLQTVVNRIDIPQANLEGLDYTRLITDSFEGSEVRDEAVDKLQHCHQEALQKVLIDLEQKLQEKRSEIECSLRTAGNEFANQLIAELKVDTERNIAELHDKENIVKRFRSYLTAVDSAFQGLAEEVG